MSNTPGGNNEPPAQAPSTTAPTGRLADMPATDLWLGLHGLVEDDAACGLFNTAARMVISPGAHR